MALRLQLPAGEHQACAPKLVLGAHEEAPCQVPEVQGCLQGKAGEQDEWQPVQGY